MNDRDMAPAFTYSDLAKAWESGYWHGTSHTGPLNDAAIRARNPYLKWTDEEQEVCS